MRKLKIIGWGSAIPNTSISFNRGTCFRMQPQVSLLDYVEEAVNKALMRANLKMEEIDLIVGAMATPLQPLPCNASLILERCGLHHHIPTFDINSSCTSFITALDMVSYLVEAKRYHHVLIVSGDAASKGLNPNEKESYELFSDAATAIIISSTDEEKGVLYANQKTWAECVHDTEIKGGGGLQSALELNESNIHEYQFHMEGRHVLQFSVKHLPEFIEQCITESQIDRNTIDHVIPHQASPALDLVMKKLKFEKGTYINRVTEYGNMISASIPYVLCQLLEEGKIVEGNKVVLMGTAAGLTVNYLTLQI